MQSCWYVLLQMRKEMEAGQWRGQDKQKLAEDQAAQQGANKVAPKPYMSAQYKEDTMRTTGNNLPALHTLPLPDVFKPDILGS